MKNLNRKEYKKTIKEFRKSNPITQVDHKWIYVKDIYGYEWIMFVHGSIVKRHTIHNDKMCKWFSSTYNKYFQFNGFNFTILLYGDKSFNLTAYDGLHIRRIYSSVEIYDNKNEFKVLTEDEVEKLYNKFFDDGKKFYKHIFVNKS